MGRMSSHIVWSVLAVCGAGAAACGPSPTGLDGVSLTVEAEAYAVGDTAWATLVNNRPEPVGYSFCLADLQRHERWEWVSVARLPDNGACVLLLPLLHPGESSRGMQIMYPFLDPGVYRFVAEAWIEDSPHPVVSNTFVLSE